ncbi:hypothetical protein UM93_09005 [Psychromicrobium lacuslunae]|uniref:Dipeptidyl aminopeptidase n=2 Tax=Psychromicrobium lacuslunae TaxID=1618207 RepID=A0A0D4C3P3_9MICC|nr:hypothetical protein UM93_09005 [Psychromicrobium lacuslunae]
MKLLFEDQAYSYETLRAAGYASGGGADLGEIIASCTTIAPGDQESWWQAWHSLAARLDGQGQQLLDAGDQVSAESCWLRASNYYRTAEFFLHGNPDDPQIYQTSQRAVQAFAKVAAGDPAVPGSMRERLEITEISIPYQTSTLPGWWLSPQTGAEVTSSRPTLIITGGFDSTAEELYFVAGRDAVLRGWNCLIFDGPGQGRALREQGLFYRPDWEAVISPVIDFCLGRPGVDENQIALLGMSQGGYFSARAAAFEPRIAALVSWDGVYDVASALRGMLPGHVIEAALAGRLDEADEALAELAQHSGTLHWALANGTWSYGLSRPAEFVVEMFKYTLADGIAERISCPTLIFDAEDEHFFPGQPAELEKHLKAPVERHLMLASEGAGEHCNAGSLSNFHAVLFPWLNQVLPQQAALEPR